MAKQLIYYHWKLLGERKIPDLSDLGSGYITGSYLYICGRCGEVWGAAVHDHPGAYYNLLNSHCAAHARWQSDGCFTLNQPCFGHPLDEICDPDSWPLEVLIHDFLQISAFRITNKLRKELTCV